jgi:FKBP-type peptidyl-prolyl cis-trans isomerase
LKAKKNREGKFLPKARVEVDGKSVDTMSELRRRKCVVFVDTYFVKRTSESVTSASWSLNISGILARDAVDMMIDVAVNDSPITAVDDAFACTDAIEDFFSSSPKKASPTTSDATPRLADGNAEETDAEAPTAKETTTKHHSSNSQAPEESETPESLNVKKRDEAKTSGRKSAKKLKL